MNTTLHLCSKFSTNLRAYADGLFTYIWLDKENTGESEKKLGDKRYNRIYMQTHRIEFNALLLFVGFLLFAPERILFFFLLALILFFAHQPFRFPSVLFGLNLESERMLYFEEVETGG